MADQITTELLDEIEAAARSAADCDDAGGVWAYVHWAEKSNDSGVVVVIDDKDQPVGGRVENDLPDGYVRMDTIAACEDDATGGVRARYIATLCPAVALNLVSLAREALTARTSQGAVTITDEMVEAALTAFNASVNAPQMVPCPKCEGRGYHHGYGEDGADPDWCSECGGNQFNVVPGEEERAMRAALEAAARVAPEPVAANRLLRDETTEWQTDRADGTVTVHSRMIDGVLCRWWGDGAPPAGVAKIDAALYASPGSSAVAEPYIVIDEEGNTLVPDDQAAAIKAAFDAVEPFAPFGKPLRKALKFALASAPPQREGLEGWQDISTAPKDGTEIMLICATAYEPTAFEGWWADGGWQHYSRDGDHGEKFSHNGIHVWFPTHWQPKPTWPRRSQRREG